MDSDYENDDDCEYEMSEQRTNERRIEQQLDEFRTKWKTEIQQRTVYGHVLQDKQQQEPIDHEEQAKHFFQRATELEREGKLYDAIKYYRAAMQLVPDIEFRMDHRGQQQPTTTTTTTELNHSLEHLDSDQQLETDSNLLESFQHVNIDENELSTICTKNFPQQATHISSLPFEVMIYIFRWIISSDLDVRSLEQCARVCRGFYRCARDTQLWKMICFKTWGTQTGKPLSNTNWRHMFIHRPHVVFNGVYISRATYVRQGEQSLDTFYSPWHLVEYYRYIRFFPDGMVMIYTSADEPRITVARLKSRFTSKEPGIIYGNYRFQSNRVVIFANRVAQRSTIATNAHRRGGRENQPSDVDQIIHMEFEMADVAKKKHHQLVWTHYEIQFKNRRTGDERTSTLDVADRNTYPNLIFSRVKSYTLAAEQFLK